MSDDIETSADISGTDAGGSLANNIHATETPDGKPIYHGVDALRRATQEANETLARNPNAFAIKYPGHKEDVITAEQACRPRAKERVA